MADQAHTSGHRAVHLGILILNFRVTGQANIRTDLGPGKNILGILMAIFTVFLRVRLVDINNHATAGGPGSSLGFGSIGIGNPIKKETQDTIALLGCTAPHKKTTHQQTG